jgi:BirA family biotin operon repressor/biotin-[acetyl-CoA-carboxylase] ligase
VMLSDGQHGMAHGVDEGGALLVHTAAGMQHVTSSEISVRPRAAPQP